MPQVSVVEIGNNEAISRQVPTRKLVYLVLLLALKDRATEVRFEPSETDSLWKLRYEVAGTWYDMVPVPLNVPVCAEICRLAGIRPLTMWHRLLVWGKQEVGSIGASIHLAVLGKSVEVVVTLARRPRGRDAHESVALRLPAEEAGQILQDYVRRHKRTNSEESFEER